MADPRSTDSPTVEPVSDLPDVREPPYDPEPRRELWRGVLAFTLVLMVAAVFVASFAALALRWATEAEIKDLVSVILTPLVALASSAVAFYFAGRGRA